MEALEPLIQLSGIGPAPITSPSSLGIRPPSSFPSEARLDRLVSIRALEGDAAALKPDTGQDRVPVGPSARSLVSSAEFGQVRLGLFSLRPELVSAKLASVPLPSEFRTPWIPLKTTTLTPADAPQTSWVLLSHALSPAHPAIFPSGEVQAGAAHLEVSTDPRPVRPRSSDDKPGFLQDRDPAESILLRVPFPFDPIDAWLPPTILRAARSGVADPSFRLVWQPTGFLQEQLGPPGHHQPHGQGPAAWIASHGMLEDAPSLNAAHLASLQANAPQPWEVPVRRDSPTAESAGLPSALDCANLPELAALLETRPAATQHDAQGPLEDAPPIPQGLGELLFLDPARLGHLVDQLRGSLQSYLEATQEAPEQGPTALGSPVSWLLVVLASVLIHQEVKRRRRGQQLGAAPTSNSGPIPDWLP